MTDPLTPVRLATIRATADGPDWPQWGDGDVRELLDEIDRLTAELADSQAECGALQGELIAAHGARDAMHRRAWTAQQALREIRALGAAALGPHGVRDVPQPHAERPTAGFAATEATEGRSEPPRPAEAVGWSPYGPVSGIVVSGETARTGILPASEEDVMALSLGIAGFDAPIDWASVAAQPRQDGPTAPQSPEPAVGDDDATPGPQESAQAVVWRTPETWCALHGIQIIDPDGWRGTTAPPWEQPITEAEFWERAGRSTTNAIQHAHDGNRPR